MHEDTETGSFSNSFQVRGSTLFNHTTLLFKSEIGDGNSANVLSMLILTSNLAKDMLAVSRHLFSGLETTASLPVIILFIFSESFFDWCIPVSLNPGSIEVQPSSA
ncbi:uncharacterized protein METZ01_LOCUS144502 [marine metagenome]|uniref:Uncharacterized protein n=1 Tax=marine metagenome TaxID=408172 RepID=A0A381ZQT0_9ZZZZ